MSVFEKQSFRRNKILGKNQQFKQKIQLTSMSSQAMKHEFAGGR